MSYSRHLTNLMVLKFSIVVIAVFAVDGCGIEFLEF